MIYRLDCHAQVSELESIFNMLDADVNGLLMTGPPVALDELYHAEGQAQAALSDQASLLQVQKPAPNAGKNAKNGSQTSCFNHSPMNMLVCVLPCVPRGAIIACLRHLWPRQHTSPQMSVGCKPQSLEPAAQQ